VRIPLEYGDNFPVPSGSWDPSIPWRFPKHELLPDHPSPVQRILPWITLGLGMALGVLWVNWQEKPRTDWNPPPVQAVPTEKPSQAYPSQRPPAGLAVRRV
jgi:hypothetical protein